MPHDSDEVAGLSLTAALPLVDGLLEPWADAIGADYEGYRNHVYRVAHFGHALRDLSTDERAKVLIAAAFHDLGIWTDGTFDYLDPSIALARAYLAENGLDAWIPEVEAMIDLHHRVRPVRDAGRPLVEVFRRADWIDVSLGALRFGLPRSTVRAVRAAFPNAGFHRRLVRLTVERWAEHPLSPIPVLKW